MRHLLPYFICLGLGVSCSSYRNHKIPDKIEIIENHPDKKTALTKQNLKHLTQIYDLEPFLFVKKIQIGNKLLPLTFKMLAIDTQFSTHPNKLLSRFLHTELHIWIAKNKTKTMAAMRDLKKIYLKVPNEILPNDKIDNYRHLIVCFLEYEALKFYIGEKEASLIISEFMKRDKIFPWTYFQILHKNFAIKQTIKRHGLLPAILN